VGSLQDGLAAGSSTGPCLAAELFLGRPSQEEDLVEVSERY
jgi:hypothetical protein